jgi:hypothetical protein
VEDLKTGKESLFGPPKWRKVAQRDTCILQPRVPCPLKNLIFRPPKGRTEALWNLDNFRSMVSWHSSNRSFRTSKYYKGFHWKPCTLEHRVSQLDRTCLFRAS